LPPWARTPKFDAGAGVCRRLVSESTFSSTYRIFTDVTRNFATQWRIIPCSLVLCRKSTLPHPIPRYTLFSPFWCSVLKDLFAPWRSHQPDDTTSKAMPHRLVIFL